MFKIKNKQGYLNIQPERLNSKTINKYSSVVSGKTINQKQKANQQQTKYIFGWAKNQLMLAIAILIVILLTILIVTCSIANGIYIFKTRIDKQKKTKDNINFQLICPNVSYDKFLNQISEPFQQQCCICLDQFQAGSLSYLMPQDGKKQEQQNNVSEYIDDIGIKQTWSNSDYINQVKQTRCRYQNLIKLTYCGHLFHSKCFDKWIKKQHTCPICREQFTFQNIKIWEIKAGFCLKSAYQCFIEQELYNLKKLESQNRKIGQLCSLGSQQIIVSKKSDNDQQESIDNNKHEQTNQNIFNSSISSSNNEQKYGIYLYSKIMKFHKKQINTINEQYAIDMPNNNWIQQRRQIQCVQNQKISIHVKTNVVKVNPNKKQCTKQ